VLEGQGNIVINGVAQRQVDVHRSGNGV
jgi:hypothetical protein